MRMRKDGSRRNNIRINGKVWLSKVRTELKNEINQNKNLVQLTEMRFESTTT